MRVSSRAMASAFPLVRRAAAKRVHPAASLMHYVKPETSIFYLDPNPAIDSNNQITVIAKKATEGIKEVIDLMEN